MAEVSSHHRFRNHHHRHQPPDITVSSGTHPDHEEEDGEEEFYHEQNNPFLFDFDSFSPPDNPNPTSFFIPYDYDYNCNDSLHFGFDAENPDPNCFFFAGDDVGHDTEQMNFVTDLFGPRESRVADEEEEEPVWDFDSGQPEDLDTEFGFGPGLESASGPSVPGLRVAGLESDTDSEEFELNSGFIDHENDNDEYDDSFTGRVGYHMNGNEREEFEWEEVSERIQFDERENLNSVIDRIEEISVSSDITSSEGEPLHFGEEEGEGGGEGGRNLEWEVLLAVNNLDRNFGFENLEEELSVVDRFGVGRINHPEDYILTMDNDALFDQLVENENALKGSPPAAKSVVESLPCLVLTKDEVMEKNNAVVCAVCKDDVEVGEKMTKMPCCHLYHGDCILPWLRIRNTCPVCRYELPTDDADYERKRNERGGGGAAAQLADDLQLRYSFEFLP